MSWTRVEMPTDDREAHEEGIARPVDPAGDREAKHQHRADDGRAADDRVADRKTAMIAASFSSSETTVIWALSPPIF